MPVSPPTFTQLYNIAKNEIMDRDPTLTDFSEGSNLDAIAGSAAVLADETNRYNLLLFKAHFLDTADGTDLDALALDRFGLTRNTTSTAIGQIFWTEGSASGYTIPLGTTIEGTLPDGSTVSAVTTETAQSDSGLPIPVQASVSGRAGNLAALTLTAPSAAFVTDPTATVTQPSRLAGGGETETDAQFRDRLRKYYSTLAKATVKALQAAAESVSGVYFAVVKEAFGTDGGQVTVYVADIDGSGNASLVTAADAVLQVTRAAGIYLVTTAATREEFSLSVNVGIYPGMDQTAAEAQVRAAVLDYANNVPISASIYSSQIDQVAHNALGNKAAYIIPTIGGLTFVEKEPAADTNTLRLPDGNLTVTFTEEVP